MKGRHFLHFILIGLVMYFLINLHFQYPDWYKNQIIQNIFATFFAILGVLQILTTIGFIIVLLKSEYEDSMDDVFDNPWYIIILACIMSPVFVPYEVIARFFDKHLTIKNNEG